MRSDNEHARSVARIRHEGRERLAREIGSETLAGWRRHVRAARREEERSGFLLSGSTDFVAKDAQLRARTRAEARRVQTELGVDPSRVRAVFDWTAARIAEAGRSRPSAGPTSGRLLTELDPGATTTDGHWGSEWLAFAPPYASQDSLQEGVILGVGVESSAYEDALSGRVGQRLRNWTTDATSVDFAEIFHHSTNAVIFIVPETGRLRVRVMVEAESAHHHLRLEDEFGMSCATTEQWNRLTMQCFTEAAGALQELTVSHFRINESNHGYWDRNFVAIGEPFWVEFMSDRSYAKGEIVWMDVGSRSMNSTLVDDVEVDSVLSFRWILHQILVRPV